MGDPLDDENPVHDVLQSFIKQGPISHQQNAIRSQASLSTVLKILYALLSSPSFKPFTPPTRKLTRPNSSSTPTWPCPTASECSAKAGWSRDRFERRRSIVCVAD